MDKLQKHCPPSPCTHTCELAYTHTHTPLTLGFGPAIWTPCLMRSVCGTVSCPPPLPEPGAEGFFQCLGHHKGGWTSDGRQGHHLERINIDYLIHCQEPPTKIHSPCKAPLPVDIGKIKLKTLPRFPSQKKPKETNTWVLNKRFCQAQ